MIERIVHLGFDVRLELTRADGERLSAQMTRDTLRASSSSRQHQIVTCGHTHERRFQRDGLSATRSTRSASVVSSSTPRMLVRSSIQTSCRAVAAPV